MDEARDLLAGLGGKVLAGEHLLEAGAQDGDGGLQLVGGIGREPGGALKLLARRLQRGLGAVPVRPVRLRVHREPLHRGGKAPGDELAREEGRHERESARAHAVPDELALARKRLGERVRRDLEGGRERRTLIEARVEEQVRLAVGTELEPAVLAPGRRDRGGKPGLDHRARLRRESRERKVAAQEYAPVGPRIRPPDAEGAVLEADHDRGERLAALGGDDRHRDHLVDGLLLGARGMQDVACLRAVGKRRERKRRFLGRGSALATSFGSGGEITRPFESRKR